jgi:hypothetical protein
MTALVSIKGKVRNWPAYGFANKHWAVTMPVAAGVAKWPNAPFHCITHQPTGLKAAEVSPDKAMRCARRFAKIFGGAQTVRGVRRKYNALSASEKKWINKQWHWSGK